jgi:hypothetical protein
MADWRRKLLLLKLLSHIHSAHGKHFSCFARKIRECLMSTYVCWKDKHAEIVSNI